MSAWIDLYEDYRDRLKLYQETPDVTPVEFMRKYSYSLRYVQRLTGYVRAMKTATSISSTQDGTIYSLTDPPGDDVETLLIVWDPYNREVFPAQSQHFQDTYELAQMQHNDFPRHQAVGKPGTPPPASFVAPYVGNIENRMYWQPDRTQIIVYPEVPNAAPLRLYYIVSIPAFSSTASWLWNNFFPLDTQFEPAFLTAIPVIFDPLEEAALYHALYTQLQAQRHPAWQEILGLFREQVEVLNKNMPTNSVGSQSPYGISI